MVEGILILLYWIIYHIIGLYGLFNDRDFKCCQEFEEIFPIYMKFCLPVIFIFIICQSIFLGRIIKHDLSYNCSDRITNEVFRNENEKTKHI